MPFILVHRDGHSVQMLWSQSKFLLTYPIEQRAYSTMKLPSCILISLLIGEELDLVLCLFR